MVDEFHSALRAEQALGAALQWSMAITTSRRENEVEPHTEPFACRARAIEPSLCL